MLAFYESLKGMFRKNRILIENFTYLSTLQAVNLLLFIVTIPYLFRILGGELYGLIVFAQTIVFYFSVFINFGFNLTATRDISICRNDRVKMREIISAVLSVKILFFAVSLGLMTILVFCIPQLKVHRNLYLFSMLAGLSEALFPVWYFQGLEKMKYITGINIATRLLATVLIFVFIRGPSDYIIYPFIAGSGTISGALIALYIVFVRHRVTPIFLPLAVIKFYIRENLLYFFSNVSTQLYLNANRLVVGTFLGMVEVAYYDIAEKIVNMAKVPLSILGQTLFPRISQKKDLKPLKRTMVFTFALTVAGVLIISLFSDFLLTFISGNSIPEKRDVLKILALSLIPISLSLFYGDLLLINYGMKEEYALVRFLGFMVYLILFLVFYASNNLGVRQVALIILLVESFTAIYSFILSGKLLKPEVV